MSVWVLHVRKCEKLLHATHQDLAALVAAVYVTWPFDATGFVSLPSGGSSSLPSSTSRLPDLPNDALRQKSGS